MDDPEGDDEPGQAVGGALRIDRWLWHARFFRTRSLAQRAVEGGHVQVGGERVRPSRLVRIGDRLRVVRDRERYEIVIVGMPARRGPAPEARRCYTESEESIAARHHARELARLSTPGPSSRPDKRDRRELIRTLKRGG